MHKHFHPSLGAQLAEQMKIHISNLPLYSSFRWQVIDAHSHALPHVSHVSSSGEENQKDPDQLDKKEGDAELEEEEESRAGVRSFCPESAIGSRCWSKTA